ncbi:DEAD-box ATP-dependent RNA helicase 16-like [Rosa rugosa]|uniref:DEAD-box ATP-dependent RNA helicase 16-like n=1 Tax=Rosa rugosa TaxID=74645 RepID=UPI002B41129A|nr:DEAD-box ATP-dependent RNA helicase 16-like [Rosa rugosa]
MPSLVLDRDQTIKNAIKQVEEMRKDLSNALHATETVESRTAVAEVVEIDGGSGSASLTDLLKHDKVLSKKPPAPHRVVPDYLLNATTKEASKRVKLANLGRRGFKKKFKEDKDPLKSFSAQVYFSFLFALISS